MQGWGTSELARCMVSIGVRTSGGDVQHPLLPARSRGGLLAAACALPADAGARGDADAGGPRPAVSLPGPSAVVCLLAPLEPPCQLPWCTPAAGSAWHPPLPMPTQRSLASPTLPWSCPAHTVPCIAAPCPAATACCWRRRSCCWRWAARCSTRPRRAASWASTRTWTPPCASETWPTPVSVAEHCSGCVFPLGPAPGCRHAPARPGQPQ